MFYDYMLYEGGKTFVEYGDPKHDPKTPWREKCYLGNSMYYYGIILSKMSYEGRYYTILCDRDFRHAKIGILAYDGRPVIIAKTSNFVMKNQNNIVSRLIDSANQSGTLRCQRRKAVLGPSGIIKLVSDR